MKVLALIEAPEDTHYRHRLGAVAWALAQRDLCLVARPLRKFFLARLGQLALAATADMVIVQRRLLPWWQLRLLRRCARRLVYDVDAAVFRRDRFSQLGAWCPLRLARFRATVLAADAVIVGNEYLQHYTAAYTDPARIHLVPTCVQPGGYRPAVHQRTAAAVRLAWIGRRSTLPSLDLPREHLAAVGQRLPGVQLRLLGAQGDGPIFAGVPIAASRRCPTAPANFETIPSSAETATEALADCDIGLGWLPDDLWSQGSCGLKILQYMAAGLPVVANPVGIHQQLVRHGETGLLAANPSQWADAIAALAADPALRGRLGAAARRRVEQHYNVDHWGPRLAEILGRLTRRPSETGDDRSAGPYIPPPHLPLRTAVTGTMGPADL